MSILSVDNIQPIGSGTSVTVNSAATLVLTNANSTGVITATSFVGNLTGNVTGTASANAVLTGSTNNTLVTVTGANAITGESTLTFNGTDLEIQPASAAPALFIGDSNRTGAGQGLVHFRGNWNGTTVARITIDTGDDTTNKDDGIIRFDTSSTGSLVERVRINRSGYLGIGNVTSPDDKVEIRTTANDQGVLIKSTGSTSNAIKFDANRSGANQGLGSIKARWNGTTVAQMYMNTGDDTSDKNDGYIIFGTESAASNGNANATERLRIQSDGYVWVNKSNTDANSHIVLDKSASGSGTLRFYTAGSQSAYIQLDPSEDMYYYGGSGVNQIFYAGGGERAKMTADGYSKFTSNGTYDGYSNAAQAHEFRQSLNKPTLWCSNSSSAQTWEIIRAESARTNNSAFGFISCTSGNLTDDEFRVRGDGQVYADGSFNSGGADYAEYFEWTDGNSSNEDRRGMTVVLDGNKVKLSTLSDSTDNIIGVVSGNASVIGDAASEKWTDKYLRDDYGAYQRDENGERKLNPSFDNTKTYVSREDRQEWDAIGMVGKLRIRKGQITGTRWIKMRDISDTVEEWLVR